MNSISEESVKNYRKFLDPQSNVGRNFHFEILVLEIFLTTRAFEIAITDNRDELLDKIHSIIYHQACKTPEEIDTFIELLNERYIQYRETLDKAFEVSDREGFALLSLGNRFAGNIVGEDKARGGLSSFVAARSGQHLKLYLDLLNRKDQIPG